MILSSYTRPAYNVLQFVARTNMSFQPPGWYSNVAGLSASSFMQQLLQLTSVVAYMQNPTGTDLSPENKLHAWLKQKYDSFCHALKGLLQAPNNNLQVCLPLPQSCVTCDRVNKGLKFPQCLWVLRTRVGQQLCSALLLPILLQLCWCQQEQRAAELLSSFPLACMIAKVSPNLRDTQL